jgi:hypothetical protein
MSSNKNSNNSTNIKCTNFIGNTCLDWLLFKKEWLLYAQNLGVEEIITRGTYGGVDFKELIGGSRTIPFATSAFDEHVIDMFHHPLVTGF